jgi:hypothetical protein
MSDIFFEDFIIEIANMEHDDYSGLSKLPEKARQILIHKFNAASKLRMCG